MGMILEVTILYTCTFCTWNPMPDIIGGDKKYSLNTGTYHCLFARLMAFVKTHFHTKVGYGADISLV